MKSSEQDEVYMGRTRVFDKEQFKDFWEMLKKEGAELRSTAVGDPPTAVLHLDGKIVAQYFVAWVDDLETYYVDPERWEAWLKMKEKR